MAGDEVDADPEDVAVVATFDVVVASAAVVVGMTLPIILATGARNSMCIGGGGRGRGEETGDGNPPDPA